MMLRKTTAFVLLLLPLLGTAQPLEVVKLTGETFEHQTQASTGQTTGQWCVLFLNSSSSSSAPDLAAEKAWEQLATVEEKPAIMAKVDVSTSAGLAKRFSIHSTPAAILLRDRAMYPFTLDSSPEAEPQTLAAAVEAFIDGGYEQQDARAVPAEPSALSLLVELASFLEVQPNIFFYTGVACISIGVILFIGFFSAGLWYSLPDKKQPAAATMPAAAVRPASAAAEDSTEAEVTDSGATKAATTRLTRRRA